MNNSEEQETSLQLLHVPAILTYSGDCSCTTSEGHLDMESKILTVSIPSCDEESIIMSSTCNIPRLQQQSLHQ